MKKGFWKRTIAGTLAFIMLAGGTGSQLRMVKAEDLPEEAIVEENAGAITDEEFLQMMSEYENATATEADQMFFQDLALKAMKHVAGKVFDKFEDKAYDKLFAVIFGESDPSQEILKQLGELNGKVSQISEMLNQIAAFLKKKELEDSIGIKNEDILCIKSAADQAVRDFEAARNGNPTEKEIDNRRWTALQKWYDKFSLGGTGNAMTSFRKFTYRLTNEENVNGKLGNYVQHYEAYGKYAFDWDTERVAFTQAQKDRDFYYVMQIASLNLLYLQYAENHGVGGINYKDTRLQIQELLNSIIKTYEETQTVKNFDDRVHFEKVTKAGLNGEKDQVKAFTIFKQKGCLSSDFIKQQLLSEVRYERYIWDIRDNFRKEMEKNKPEGYHLMTNGERNELAEFGGKRDYTMWDYLAKGGIDMNSNGGQFYLATTYNRDHNCVYAYSDTFDWTNRTVYFQNYDMKQKDGNRNSTVGVVDMRWNDHDKFAVFAGNYGSKLNKCFSSQNEHLADFINNNYAYLWVRDDSTRAEAEDNQEFGMETGLLEVNGIVTDVIQLENGRFQIALQTDTDMMQVICDETTIIEGELKAGEEVTVKYVEGQEGACGNTIVVKQKDAGQEVQSEENKPVQEGKAVTEEVF